MTEQELSRGAARRLAIIQHVEEVSGNVAMTCRYFGISRHTFHYWLRRESCAVTHLPFDPTPAQFSLLLVRLMTDGTVCSSQGATFSSLPLQ